MRIPKDAKERDLLLHKLRHAVAFQIGLWDAASMIAEAIDSELGIVLDYVMNAAVTADDGIDLSYANLDESLRRRPAEDSCWQATERKPVAD